MARILMVDDDEQALKLMREWLELDEHSVETAVTGAGGWQLLDRESFDAVILDWDLPDINGVDLLKRFRKTGGTTPVLLLTGRASVDNKEEGLDAGADDYLTKPFHMKELSARIRALIRRGETQAAHKPLAASDQALLKKAGLIGTALASRLEFLEVVGEGGVGIVYKARHPQMDKLVAVKMLQKEELDEEVAARFETEARAISRLDHPNIATIYDFGMTETRRSYIVMEYITGKDLDDLFAERKKLTVEEAVDLFAQICDGMSHAHLMGILHRDLKPSNVMLKEVTGSQPLVKILDFGCAKLRYPDGPKSPALTQKGQAIGSPLYMSPEHINGQPTDERSDIYSLGCMLFEALTGYLPFAADDPIAVLVKHINEPVPSINSVGSAGFPREVERLVAKSMQKEPQNRIQTMSEFKELLLAIKPDSKGKKSGPWWSFLGGRKEN